MLFNSLTFLFIFLPTAILSYYLIDIKLWSKSENQKWKQLILNSLLTGFSLCFFAWDNIDNVKVLIALIFVNYVVGMTKRESRGMLLFGIAYDLYILTKYKYLTFIFSVFHIETPVRLIAPIGISFIIFHCISYLMDLYQDREDPEHNLLNFVVYITFFQN